MILQKDVCMACACIAMLLSGAVRAELTELTEHVPAGANVIVFADMVRVHDSALAEAENWAQRHADAYANQPIFLPPDAQQAIIAAWAPDVRDLPLWQIAAMKMGSMPSLPLMAKANGGYLDQFGMTPAVWTPLDAYFVKLAPTILGVAQPADRQFTARWAQKARAARPVMSDYLQYALDPAQRGDASIVVALDMTDKVRRHDVEYMLTASEALADRGLDERALMDLLLGVNGVRLTVDIQDTANATLHVDFQDDPSMLSDVAAAFTLEVLSDIGASIDGLDQWQDEIDGTSIVLRGELPLSGLRRIFSWFSLARATSDATVPDDATDAGDGAAPGEPDVAQTTLAYYRAVAALIQDLSGNRNATHVGMWMTRYAEQIDAMPILDVDADMHAFGAQVAAQMRDAAERAGEANHRFDTRIRDITDNHRRNAPQFRTDGMTQEEMDDVLDEQADRNRQRATDRKQAQADRRNDLRKIVSDTMSSITNAQANIRRSMTERYGMEF